MNFEDFCAKLEILDEEEGNRVRDKYIEKFVDAKHPLYESQIKHRHKFSDGYCYEGYLWDYLKSKYFIEKEKIGEKAKTLGTIYVFWDIHSCERIFVKNYWKFGKNTVLKLPFSILMEGQQYLPEDIYIFDEKMTWTFVITHEDIDGTCYCLKSGNI
ncbi:MAG: hypothetical protein KH452_04085 [Clostridiales bacterium]|nr:hypothetical protein [Clostridiales bacterium]